MLELDRRALVLSRVLAVGLAVFFLVVAVRFYRRREADATRIVHRLRPRPLLARPCGWLPGRSSRWSRAPGWRSR